LQDPFPLYPGEELKDGITPLTVVLPDQALKLRAALDCQDHTATKRVAGDEWLFVGPGTYVPNVGVEVMQTVQAVVINLSQALRLRAEKELTDSAGKRRVTGEEWMVETSGA
jgi:major vault protein